MGSPASLFSTLHHNDLAQEALAKAKCVSIEARVPASIFAVATPMDLSDDAMDSSMSTNVRGMVVAIHLLALLLGLRKLGQSKVIVMNNITYT